MPAGRKMQIRVSYDADAKFLLSFKDAIERDESLDPEWSKQTCLLVANLVALLLNPKKKSGSAKRRTA